MCAMSVHDACARLPVSGHLTERSVEMTFERHLALDVVILGQITPEQIVPQFKKKIKVAGNDRNGFQMTLAIWWEVNLENFFLKVPHA